MFDYFKQIFVMILLNSFINADEYYIYRHKRAIGGESLDTSNFVLYIDPNGTRFIEVPRDFMNNWLGDQKMWRTVRVNNSFFEIFLFVFSGQLY